MDLMSRRRVLLAQTETEPEVWDYSWSFESGIAPPESTYRAITFQSDGADIAELILNPFPNNYLKEIMAEISFAPMYGNYSNEPQLTILTNNLIGAKMYGSNTGVFLVSNYMTTVKSIPLDRDYFHLWRIVIEDGVIYCYIDGDLIGYGSPQYNQYNTTQGIYTANINPAKYYRYKSIKMKKGALK